MQTDVKRYFNPKIVDNKRLIMCFLLSRNIEPKFQYLNEYNQASRCVNLRLLTSPAVEQKQFILYYHSYLTIHIHYCETLRYIYF